MVEARWLLLDKTFNCTLLLSVSTMFPGATFSYQGGLNPPIDYPRLMISDTNQFLPDGVTPGYVFADQEITAITNMLVLVNQSAQFYSPPISRQIPNSPVSYWRIAAALLDCMASNKAKLASITRILDVELDPSRAAKFLMAQAAEYRKLDDESGGIWIIEQVNNDWTLMDRYWKQVQRQQGVGFGG